jgi:hypothetical protein
MALDFPSSPTEGQVFKYEQALGAVPKFFTFTNGRWEVTPKQARSFNYLVNGAFQVDQEVVVGASNANGVFVADGWWFSTTLTANCQVERVAFASQNNSKYRYRTHVWTALASLAATEYVQAPIQAIEGSRFQSFGWGTAYPKPALLRFWLTAPAGTYAVSIRNGGTTRSYIIPIVVVVGNVNALYEFVIPPDVTGAWPRGNVAGAYVAFIWACGTTFQAPATNTWVDGNFLSFAGMSNGVATLNNMFELQDVGLYLDADGSGKFPPWTIDPDSVAMNESKRYFYKARNARGGSTSTTAVGRMGAVHPTMMRAAPAVSKNGSGGRLHANGTASISTISAVISNERLLEYNATAVSAALTALKQAIHNTEGVGSTVCLDISARM